MLFIFKIYFLGVHVPLCGVCALRCANTRLCVITHWPKKGIMSTSFHLSLSRQSPSLTQGQAAAILLSLPPQCWDAGIFM